MSKKKKYRKLERTHKRKYMSKKDMNKLKNLICEIKHHKYESNPSWAEQYLIRPSCPINPQSSLDEPSDNYCIR